MNKILKLAAVAVVATSVMTGCTTKKCSTDFKVGLVTDTGGIDDKSFNQGTWEGVKKFATEAGLCETTAYSYVQSEKDTDYIPNLSSFGDKKFNLVVAPGFLFEKAMGEVAAKYPNQKFLIIDTVVKGANVASATFAEHEGSYLVGVAAGLQAKADGKKTLGFIGGMKFPLIEKFQAGFEAGVKAVYPEAKVLVDYSDSFSEPAKGQALAKKQFDQGAYIIFHAAGATGNGMIKEAQEQVKAGKKVWAIGVDKDQYEDGKMADGKSVILTSMMKRVDVASYEISKLAKEGKFEAKNYVFDIKNDGVGIPATNPNLSKEIVAEVAKYQAKIKSGEIKVSEVPGK